MPASLISFTIYNIALKREKDDFRSVSPCKLKLILCEKEFILLMRVKLICRADMLII